ncbi:hypothetical protein KCP70_13460 [Salmonella enterica subsp. enterica]|nr:hypothetical protein KCP70_13460 [Salmonella enterica subsp. enterica]
MRFLRLNPICWTAGLLKIHMTNVLEQQERGKLYADSGSSLSAKVRSRKYRGFTAIQSRYWLRVRYCFALAGELSPAWPWTYRGTGIHVRCADSNRSWHNIWVKPLDVIYLHHRH